MIFLQGKHPVLFSGIFLKPQCAIFICVLCGVLTGNHVVSVVARLPMSLSIAMPDHLAGGTLIVDFCFSLPSHASPAR